MVERRKGIPEGFTVLCGVVALGLALYTLFLVVVG
jgi:hypothetical protein